MQFDGFRVDTFIPLLPILERAAVDIQYLAQYFYRITALIALTQSLNYRECFMESDINRAEAFFKISFSNSSRSTRFFSSRISLCSSLIGVH